MELNSDFLDVDQSVDVPPSRVALEAYAFLKGLLPVNLDGIAFNVLASAKGTP